MPPLLGDNENKPGSFGGFFSRYPERKAQVQGLVWVSASCGRVQQFTTEGKFRRGFGEEGTQPAQFYAHHAIALDSQGCLYVVDSSNHRIQKFDVLP